jgi:hypothetical protein
MDSAIHKTNATDEILASFHGGGSLDIHDRPDAGLDIKSPRVDGSDFGVCWHGWSAHIREPKASRQEKES